MFGIHRQVLYSRSRNRPLLLKLGLTIVGISIVLAVLIWIMIGRNYDPGNRRWERARSDPEAMLAYIRSPMPFQTLANLHLAPFKMNEEEFHTEVGRLMQEVKFPGVERQLDLSLLPGEEQELFRSYLSAHSGRETRTATEYILAEARKPGRLYANEMMGDLVANRPDAREYYEEELRRRPSRHARDSILTIAGAGGMTEEYRRLIRDPGYRWGASTAILHDAAVEARDFGALLVSSLRYSASLATPGRVVIVFFTGLIWLVLLAQGAGFRKGQLVLYGAAVGLGILSTVLTLFVVTVQEDVYGKMTMQPDLVGGLIACIAGIGLREEVIKLVFFLPLLPWLLRRQNEMEALVAASLVGLGFSLQENLLYLARNETLLALTGNDSSVDRFLTASFLHATMTGFIGHAAYRMARRWRNWDQFLATFLIVVCVHGVYDAFFFVGDLEDMAPLYIVLIAVVAYYYFELAERLPWTGDKHLSPLAVFVLGMSLLIGLTLNVMYFGLNPLPNYLVFLLNCVVLIPIAFIYVNRYSRT